jgi:hypothetical protein
MNIPVLDMKTNFYPNPMKSKSTLEYNLPESGTLSIHAFNLQGQNLGILYKGYQQKGFHKIIINKNNLMSTAGVYFLTIQLNQKQKFQKILITD